MNQRIADKNQKKRNLIREAEKRGKSQLLDEQRSKLESGQMNYLEKVEYERLKMSQKAGNISHMERIEEELILKIKNTKEAFEILERTQQRKVKPSTIVIKQNQIANKVAPVVAIEQNLKDSETTTKVEKD